MNKVNLLGHSCVELEQLAVDLGDKKFKGRQLFRWLYNIRQYDFELMTDLSKSLRQNLTENYTVESLTLVDERKSTDGTVKLLFQLPEGHPVEAVIIPEPDRSTVCISTQAGCALGCKFCATGQMGLLRNLTAGEIVGQLMFIRDRLGDDAFTNVVMMGMGEPLLNFDNVIKAIRIITDQQGLLLPPKRLTISTSGVAPKIRKLADAGLKTRLAISLHAATQQQRLEIMPIAKSFDLDNLMDSIRYYARTAGQSVFFEYILIDGFNDSKEDILNLSKLVRGLSCKINVLAYNPVDGVDLRRPSEEKINWFGKQLVGRVPFVTIRQSRGMDIEAACGQLAAGQLTRRK